MARPVVCLVFTERILKVALHARQRNLRALSLLLTTIAIVQMQPPLLALLALANANLTTVRAECVCHMRARAVLLAESDLEQLHVFRRFESTILSLPGS